MALCGAALAELVFPVGVNAFEDFVLNSKVGMFHFESGPGIASFIQQMEAEGRNNLFASELVSALHQRKQLPPSYVITVDDGYVLQRGIFDHLAKLGLERKVTLYLMGGWRGDGVHSYMSDNQIKEISGIAEIGCHTRDHPTNLPELRRRNYGSFMMQIDGAKKYLEDLTGKSIWTFAYPYGVFDAPTANELANIYLGAFTTVNGSQHRLNSAMTLPRIGIN